MLQQVEQALPADIFISAAAVSDWKVQGDNQQKIKKNGDGNEAATYQLNSD